jgi:hypothetical protein
MGDAAVMRPDVRTVVSVVDAALDSHVYDRHRRPLAVMSTAAHG